MDMNSSEMVLEELKKELLVKKELMEMLHAFIIRQQSILDTDKPDVNEVDKVLREKERMYLRLDKIDIRINEQLAKLNEITTERKLSEAEGMEVKELMLFISQLGNEIKEKEEVCKEIVKKVFDQGKASVKSFRQKKGVISQYAKTMGSVPEAGKSFFMDKKK